MTRVYKDIRNGWKAEDEITLGANSVLRISTHKTSGGMLVTTATVQKREGSFLSHRMFHDFSQRLMIAKVRVTEKVVSAQHAHALEKLPELNEAITAWYAKLGESISA